MKLTDKLMPLDKETLLERINTGMKDNDISSEIIAVYLTGSRLRNLNDTQSDFDVYVITKPTRDEILSGQHLSTQIKVSGHNDIDIHCLDLLQLRKELLKGSITLLEMLSSEPIFLEDIDFAKITGLPLIEINPEKTIKSVLGMSKSVSKAIEKGKRLKDASLIVHFANLLRQYITHGYIFEVEASDNVKEWRKHVEQTQILLDSKNYTDANKEAILQSEKTKFEDVIREVEQMKDFLDFSNREKNQQVKDDLDGLIWTICKKG